MKRYSINLKTTEIKQVFSMIIDLWFMLFGYIKPWKYGYKVQNVTF